MGVSVAYLVVALAGFLVGLAELVSRYRDAPTRALYSRSAFLYMGTNALASVAALYLTLTFGWKFGSDITNPQAVLVVQTLVSGFGAIAFFRSSLFNLRIGDRDVSVGPHIVLQVILEASDRGVDRDRGTDRSAEVENIMREVSFERSHAALPTFCLALMQNLSDDAQKKLGEDIRNLREATLDQSVKSLVLGLALMNAVGYGVLQGAVKSLGSRIRPVRRIQAPAEIEVAVGSVERPQVVPVDHEDNPLPIELIAWTSDAPANVTVSDDGQITGVAIGEAGMIATADGVKVRIPVRVVDRRAGAPLVAVPIAPPVPIPTPNPGPGGT